MTQQEMQEWFADNMPEVHKVVKHADTETDYEFCTIYLPCATVGNPRWRYMFHSWDPWIPQFEKFKEDYYRIKKEHEA